jgi:threonine dehydrogenase-like Zn-dependent dehydrogenase
MRAPFQTGSFPFPVKYGYSAVGVVEKGPAELRGKTVFALHPHQSLFAVPRSSVAVLPGTVPARRGILAANMETALNGLWDSGASAGDRIAIVGAGALGCLVAGLAARIPGTEVIVIDKDHARGGAVRGLGADFIAADHARSLEADVVFHTSASGEGLSTSLQAAGFEARVLELSWYGEREVFARLGSDFHAKRLKLVSSQVGAVAESRRSRWSSSRRLEKALSLLNDPCLDALISEEIAFESLPEALPGLLAPDAPGIVTAVCYGQS